VRSALNEMDTSRVGVIAVGAYVTFIATAGAKLKKTGDGVGPSMRAETEHKKIQSRKIKRLATRRAWCWMGNKRKKHLSAGQKMVTTRVAAGRRRGFKSP